MFSLKFVAKSIALESVKMCNKHCFFNANWLPMPLPKGLPKEAFEQPKIASWASGAPLGSQGPFWRPSLDCVGRIFGLGSSLGPVFDALGTFSVFFLNFLSPWDQNASKGEHNFCFTKGCTLKDICLLFLQIWCSGIFCSDFTDWNPEGSIFML